MDSFVLSKNDIFIFIRNKTNAKGGACGRRLFNV